jgi:hypothetical protein
VGPGPLVTLVGDQADPDLGDGHRQGVVGYHDAVAGFHCPVEQEFPVDLLQVLGGHPEDPGTQGLTESLTVRRGVLVPAPAGGFDYRPANPTNLTFCV